MKAGFLVIFLFTHHVLYGQLTQTERWEKVQKASDYNFTIIPLGKDGLALFRETDKYENAKHSWQLIILDTTLSLVEDTLINIDRSYDFVGYEYLYGKLHLLFQEGEFAKNNTSLCVINIKPYTLKEFRIQTELQIRLTHFSSLASSVVLGGYLNNEPTIVLYHLNDNSVQIVPGFLKRNTHLHDLRVNTNNTFNVVSSEKTNTSSENILFKTFDEKGNLLLEDILVGKSNTSIVSSIASTLTNDDILLCGTWSTRNNNRPYGFYTSLINPFDSKEIDVEQFGTLDHFLDYLKPRKILKIKAKTKNALAKNKLYDFTTNVVPYKIIEYPEGYLIHSETYSPVSASPNNTYPTPGHSQNWNNPHFYNNPFYSPFPTSRLYQPMGFNGTNIIQNEIRTYSTSLLSINSQGKIVNDFSLKIENRKIPSITQVSDATYYAGHAYLMYRGKESIQYKKIIKLSDEIIEGQEKIRLKDSFDELRYENETEYGIRHWNENVFYTWGYQLIRNQKNKEEKLREVFYINKIRVD